MHIYIKPVDVVAAAAAQERLDNLIKPKNALGKLETMVKTYVAVKGEARPENLLCVKKGIILFASSDSMDIVSSLLERQRDLNVNVILANTPMTAMEEGAMLAQEFVSNNEYDLVCFDVVDKNELSLQAAAGAMLQTAAMKIPILHNGINTDRALKIAREREEEVSNYVIGKGDILLFDVAEPWLRAEMNFSVFDAGLKCYKEMATFQEAGVNLPL
ncbi:MAG: nicotinate-nucleotide--dimethylbenzimidazole phosphoribosyltransferase [Acidaminococcaceae bacterium]|nr:nicotinate-nucleotide--dimethylbenzimidazole phosphoribosyltransferase [Acidaminococcaceae bacterium]